MRADAEGGLSSRLTRWLETAPGWAFATYAGSVAFATYFCMYAFRKPFAVASYAGQELWGTHLQIKTAYVIAQIVGYTLSKYIGVKVCSEIGPARRGAALIVLIAFAELSLLAFAVLPPNARAFAMVANGLPLGMVWGLVVAALEGRRTSELLLAALSCSFIVSSGVVKDVGAWLMGSWGVSEAWMPFTTGLLFLPPFVLSVWLLQRLPRPTEEDVEARTERVPMGRADRIAFVRRFLPGMALLLVVYFFFTAFRDYRDNYGADVFRELGYGGKPALFTKTELPVAALVMLSLAVLAAIRDNRRGLVGTFVIMLAGSGILGASTIAWALGATSGLVWMLLTGLGSYLVYVPFNSVLFDKIIAHTKVRGTAVFAIYLADSLGYTGSIGAQLYKDLGQGTTSRLLFFRDLAWFSSGLAVVLLAGALVYFLRWRPRSDDPG